MLEYDNVLSLFSSFLKACGAMNLKKSELVVFTLVLLFYLLGVYLYLLMPEEMASHWNFKGEVDGYLPKFWALSIFPLIFTGIALLFIAIPRLDTL